MQIDEAAYLWCNFLARWDATVLLDGLPETILRAHRHNCKWPRSAQYAQTAALSALKIYNTNGPLI